MEGTRVFFVEGGEVDVYYYFLVEGGSIGGIWTTFRLVLCVRVSERHKLLVLSFRPFRHGHSHMWQHRCECFWPLTTPLQGLLSLTGKVQVWSGYHGLVIERTDFYNLRVMLKSRSA